MKPFFYLLMLLLTSSVFAQQTPEVKYCETITCYKVSADEFTMNTLQDVFNALYAKVPGIQIYNKQIGQTPVFRIRNEENHIVYIDGVRTTMEVFQALNPSDIESITVLPNANASVIPVLTQNL
ncbi:TonB-dependent Receptor Plug Domain [Pustulibacterium marinum]|uniref:TonB-dependent Receptor Plug Domain n=1 Tax=Pustulibacterium marinum TaxID=1224947 RepID=A0A1I7GD47_9FLAO|nr:TonB-dependent receptor plug domain-containing protein [Pustulibacterium marinum]SFU46251.1 TonB-dependent Receptor Plug Domain [Pustulibacterium marinum]